MDTLLIVRYVSTPDIDIKSFEELESLFQSDFSSFSHVKLGSGYAKPKNFIMTDSRSALVTFSETGDNGRGEPVI